jgi:hypothetical protein
LEQFLMSSYKSATSAFSFLKKHNALAALIVTLLVSSMVFLNQASAYTINDETPVISSTPNTTNAANVTATPIPMPSPNNSNVSLSEQQIHPLTSALPFSDGFESGDFGKWTQTGGTGGHNETVSTEHPMSDFYSAKFLVTTQDGSSYALASDLAVTDGLIANYTVNFNLLPPVWPAEIALGGLFASNGEVCQVVLRNTGGAVSWGLYDGSYHFESVPSCPSANTDYHLSLFLDKQNSGCILYVNGAEKLITATSWTQSAYTLNIGANAYMPVASGLTLYVDDVFVAEKSAAPPEPEPTPTSTPTATPSPIPTPNPLPNGTVYTLNMGMTASVGFGVYHESVLSRPIQACWIANDGTLYAGSSQILYKSLDGGGTWKPLLSFNGSIGFEITCVYVSRNHYLYVAPNAGAYPNELGLWRSIDDGQSWQHVLALPSECTIWGLDEDSNGNLFAGVYTIGTVTSNARIYRSQDNGTTWVSVYFDPSARHVHDIAVDKSTNYIYVSVGDLLGPWNTCYITRSTDGGGNWTKILGGIPQIVAIAAVPGARIFGTDDPTNGAIYVSGDDVNYYKVLDTGSQSYGFWIRRDSLNGNIFASFVGGEVSNRNAGIYISEDNGATWTLYKSFDIHAGYLGSPYGSNFVNGTMYYSVLLDGGPQNGTRIYTSYIGYLSYPGTAGFSVDSVGVATLGTAFLALGALQVMPLFALRHPRRVSLKVTSHR